MQSSEHSNPEMVEIRIACINTCLYALLEPETSSSFFEPFDLSFYKEGYMGIFYGNIQTIKLFSSNSFIYSEAWVK